MAGRVLDCTVVELGKRELTGGATIFTFVCVCVSVCEFLCLA